MYCKSNFYDWDYEDLDELSLEALAEYGDDTDVLIATSELERRITENGSYNSNY